MGSDEIELSLDAKNAIYEYLRPKVLLSAMIIAVAISLLIAAISGYASRIVNRNSARAVEDISSRTARELRQYREEINELRIAATSTFESIAESINKAEAIRIEVETQTGEIRSVVDKQLAETRILANELDSLTTDQIVLKLNDAEERIGTLTEKIDNLQSLIRPESAEDILNAARMRDEISARKDFENRLSTELDTRITAQSEIRKQYQENLTANMTDLTNRVSNSESNLSSLFYWILGIFASVVASLIAALAFFGKKIASSVNLIVKSKEVSGTDETTNTKKSEFSTA